MNIIGLQRRVPAVGANSRFRLRGHRIWFALGLAVALFGSLLSGRALGGTIWLDDLDLSKTVQGWAQPQKNFSVDHHPLSIGGKHFEHGLGTHAESALYIDLKGGVQRFTASVGVDDDVNGNTEASVQFSVVGDDKVLWKGEVMKAGQAPRDIDVNVSGVKILRLTVGDGGNGINYDHADWADAKFEITGQTPATLAPPSEPPVLLTPAELPAPSINSPMILGVQPGHPVLFTIPASGRQPLRFQANDLPPGLKLDPVTGRISGALTQAGSNTITIHASNSLGQATRTLNIVCGSLISLTPPMGWNSWNCFAGTVDDAKVRAAADAMVASGLIRHGWSYINIDDTWEGVRDAAGRIQSNEKFPDMKALAAYVHSKGLKIGIYSSPGPKTCAGFEGSWKHEQLDAAQYAAWGFDYLKYDWCSYEGVQDRSQPELARLEKPYQVMRQALDHVDRDIVFSLCQYGMGEVWRWGAEVGGNCWRTTGDISDQWKSMSSIGFGQAGHEAHAGPGHWNDPDMLVVGKLGWGQLRPTSLTANEQYTHVSLWCLLAAPLLIGCDLSQLDAFTFNLLSNDEVLAIDQDPLGRQAARAYKNGPTEIWAKDLADGSKAVGLFNCSDETSTVQAPYANLGIQGSHRIRDLWRQQDLGLFSGSFTASVPRHGVVLVRIF
jgi:alpha-galactosidase